MKRLLGAVLLLPLLAACGARPAAPAPSAAVGAALDQDTVVSRCLPQLGRTAQDEGTEVTVEPLSTDTVVPVKPLVNLHAGDLVAFYGQVEGVEDPGRVAWARLDDLCKIPASDPTGAPGSSPLPASETRASQDRPARDLQLCTQAQDVSGFFSNPELTETQVVAPDVRDYRLGSEAWDSRGLGVQVLADPTTTAPSSAPSASTARRWSRWSCRPARSATSPTTTATTGSATATPPRR